METKHYLSKKLTYSLFGSKYYHYVKSKKILLDYLIGKDYENIYNVLSRILSDNDTIIDVGANMGQYLTRISKFVTKGKIICVEPIPKNVSALRYMKKILKINNAIIIDKAIGEKEGKAIITIPKMNGIPITTQASLLENNSLNELDKEKLEVETTTIDQIVEGLSLNKVNFIKTDTEGFDSKALKSGYQTILKFKPLLRIEENCFNQEMKWLFEIGYSAFKLKNNKVVSIKNQEENFKFKGDTFLATDLQLKSILEKFNI